MIEVIVNPMEMPVGEDVCKILYKVDVKLFNMRAGANFGGSRVRWQTLWKTFGVYESEPVANFIADSIRNGQITV
jgi:hypothetical protein